MSHVCAQSAQDAPAEEAVTAGIEVIFAEYAARLIDGDADRWIQLWTEDGVQLSPGAPPAVGRDAIYAGISSEVEALEFPGMRIVKEILAAGYVAIARGIYTLMVAPKTGGDTMMVDGKFTTNFQQQEGGSWKIHRDVFSSNVP